MSLISRLRLHLIGKTDEEVKFDQVLDKMFTSQIAKELVLNKKLKQSGGYTNILTYDGSFMYQGPILMGA